MLTTNTQQAQWAKLPQKIRDVLSSENTTVILDSIGEKYDLSELERGFLMRITGKLLSGALPPTEFVKKIIADIDVTREQAIIIAQDLNRDIFNDVKDFLKEVHGAGVKPSAPKPEKPASIPSAALPAIGPALPSSPAGPIRSDWGWHGPLNKATGQVEYKREYAAPDDLLKRPFPPQGNTAGATHVGSIFEQKLGGSVRMKGETVQDETTQGVQGGTDRIEGGTLGNSIQGETLRINPQGLTLDSKKPALRVPHKPTEIKIPPAQ